MLHAFGLSLGTFDELCFVRGDVSEGPPLQGRSPRQTRSPPVLCKWHPLPFPTGFCVASALTSRSCPSVEGLKDLLVGPGVELLLTPREPALPTEAESGGNTSPGITASECQGRGPGWGWQRGLSGLGPREVSSARSLLLQADGEARTFNGSIELCRADSDSSQKVGPREVWGLG